MDAKSFLEQAYRLDKRIDSKIEQLQSLRELATKATQTLSGMPSSPGKNIHAMENSIVKMLDLEKEISEDIDSLLDIKQTIGDVIDAVPDIDCRLLLEYRYISLKPWEDICGLLNYSWPQIHRIHKKSLDLVNMIRNDIE